VLSNQKLHILLVLHLTLGHSTGCLHNPLNLFRHTLRPAPFRPGLEQVEVFLAQIWNQAQVIIFREAIILSECGLDITRPGPMLCVAHASTSGVSLVIVMNTGLPSLP
ncbi:MAG TPA: hypothetical protein VHK86_00065, partial [Nitrososphaera sp.]|nr:hypothetical protein [Nitrososphaera sp.]